MFRNSWLRLTLPLAALGSFGCSGVISNDPMDDTAPGSSVSDGKERMPGGGGSGSTTTPGNGTGTTGGSSTGGTGTGGPSAPAVPGPGTPVIDIGTVCKVNSPGPSPMRRLTRAEYNNTVRDLLAVNDGPAKAFAADSRSLGFDNIADSQTAQQLLVEQYDDAAGRMAQGAVSDLPRLMKCDATMAGGEDACAKRFIGDFTRRAFRRPADADVTRFVAFYTASKAKYGFAGAIQNYLTVILQSPSFLYRPEFGVPDKATPQVAKLTQHEVAVRLSYLIYNSMPDDALFAAADAGRLSTPAEIAGQAERMLADPKAKAALSHFYGQWLATEELGQVNKDPAIYPLWTPAVRDLLRKETETFVDSVLSGPSPKLETLLTADYTFLNKQLATFYGYTTGPQGTALEKAMLPADKRIGVLTHGSLMSVLAIANQSHPIRRGLFVREKLLCQDLPDPPPGLEVVAPSIKAGQSTRERFKVHTEVPLCANCHRMIDPVGLGFENLDGIGKWRDVDQGKVVDASGEILNSGEAALDGTFNGALALVRKIAASASARSCAVTQWFRFGYGRQETMADACTIKTLQDQFAGSGSDLKKLVIAMTQTHAFLYKTIESAAGGAL